ncbi:ABC transporter permease [Crassaminicella thermophila]|uniref:ABC transporter permease n=1 Tax=Crassaminicella thermophila TaxID=2599308 RepID=A0A5C0SBC0_CRATE|nr:ABC transporter permease [Crassaminicella thermophila]QEK11853.1 ABC transporter permease [Crassaminicella thermophila]
MKFKNTKERIIGKIVNETFLFTILAIVMGLIVGAIVIKISGFSVFEAYGAMIKGVFSKPKYIARTIIRSTPLILTGLSVAFAFRTGLFNIGAEGQFIIGALVAAMLGYFLHLPAIIHIPLVFIVAVLAAALWGGIAGYLKAKFGVNEVISTIMLNWIALYTSNYVITRESVKMPGTESSYDIHETAQITITWLKSIVGPAKINWGTLIAIIIAIIISYILFKTTLGYELRAVGHNKDAAEYGGINVKRSMILSMAIAGGLAGAAGALHVMGVSYHVSVLSAMEGYGFNGIAVSLIGNNSPLGVVLSAFLFGGITFGGARMQVLGIPTEVINIVIGSIVFFIATYRIFQFFTKFFTKKKLQKEGK